MTLSTDEHVSLVEKFLQVEEVQPGRCEDEIYRTGALFCRLSGPRSWLVEAWVVEVRERAGARLDWHYAGGIANVYYLGDAQALARLVAAAAATKPAFEEAARKKDRGTYMEDYPSVQWKDMCWA